MEKHDTPEHSRQLPQTPVSQQDFTTERNLEEKPSDQPVSNDPVAPSEDDYEYLSGLKLVLVVGTVTLVALLMLLDSSIIVTAIPKITSEFHSIPDIGWYASAYLLGNCALQPLSGKLYTHFSSKYTFVIFLAVFELGSLLCGVATSSNMLIVGRAVAGMGGSGLTNGALTIISASVPLKKRPALLGMIMSIAQLGILFGPLIGGALTQFTTWRWCFYINLPAGAAVATLLLSIRIPDRVVKEDKDAPFKQTLRKLDLLGSALFASMIIMFLLALQWGGTLYPWKSATVIGLFLGSFGVLCIFVAWERHRGSRAMIPLSMLGKRVVYSSCLTMFFTMGSVIVLTYYMPIWFQTVKGATPTLSGVYLLPMILSQMIFAIGSGILVGKLGRYLPFSIFSGTLASIGAGLMTMFKVNTSVGMWVGVQIVQGSGRGSGLQMPLVAVQNALSPTEAAIGTSLIIFCQYFGGALFGSFAETIFINSLKDGLHTFAPEVNAQVVISAGASAVRSVVSKAALPGVLAAYDQAITHAFYLATACCIGMFFACFGMGWKGIKKDKPVESKA